MTRTACITILIFALLPACEGLQYVEPQPPTYPEITLEDSLFHSSNVLKIESDRHMEQIKGADLSEVEGITADDFMRFSANVPNLPAIAERAALDGRYYDVMLAVALYHDLMQPFAKAGVIDMPAVPEWRERVEISQNYYQGHPATSGTTLPEDIWEGGWGLRHLRGTGRVSRNEVERHFMPASWLQQQYSSVAYDRFRDWTNTSWREPDSELEMQQADSFIWMLDRHKLSLLVEWYYRDEYEANPSLREWREQQQGDS